MNTHIVGQQPPIDQVAPAPSASAFTAQSIADEFPVSLHVELAAVHVHEEIRSMVGREFTLPWLECTAQYRNQTRQGVIRVVEGCFDGGVS